MPHDTRDGIIDFVNHWHERTEIPLSAFTRWLGVARPRFYQWRHRYGRINEHNAAVPRDFWLEAREKQAIIDYHDKHPLEGYRRLTFMMLDADVVACSPSSVYRILSGAGRLKRQWNRTTKKGQGFHQPIEPHEHWHIDISYVNILGTFYYLISVLDGCSRFIVHWELRQTMTELDIETVVQRALEQAPKGVSPRIISDNGPQFIARDFKEFIRLAGLSHVRTSPYYPQSNGKIERWHQTLKSECIRPGTFISMDDACRLIARFVEHYNTVRLHSAIGYITPRDRLEGRGDEIHRERDRKLEQARQQRRVRRRQLDESVPGACPC